MANRHAGRLADVHKHLMLAALLDVGRPTLYAETHAGHAVYPEQAPAPGSVPSPDDPVAERVYGVARFLDAMDGAAVLRSSAYGAVLRDHVTTSATVPGSPAVAMAVLRERATYLLCDIDPDSTADIERWAVTTGLSERVATVTADGLHAVGRRVLAGAVDPATAFVHVDPYDPFAVGDGGVSAVALSRTMITEGVAVMHWFGFDDPDQRTWAVDALSGAAPVWCGILTVTDAAGRMHGGGDLGAATTPGVGSGVVCANVPADATARCDVLSRALADAYEGVALPSGTPGALLFEALVT
jgi:23S rRNA A2030 N6-methylase RlmJ